MFRPAQRTVDHARAAARLNAPPAAAFPAFRAAPGNGAPDAVLGPVTEGKADIAAPLLGGLFQIVDQIGVREVCRQAAQLEEVRDGSARTLANKSIDIAGHDARLVQKALQAGIAGGVFGIILDLREHIRPAAISGDVNRAEALRLKSHRGAVWRAFQREGAGRVDAQLHPPAPFPAAPEMGRGGAAIEIVDARLQRAGQRDAAGAGVQLRPAFNCDAGAFGMADSGLDHIAGAIAQLPAFAVFLRIGRQQQDNQRSDRQNYNSKKPAFQRHVR